MALHLAKLGDHVRRLAALPEPVSDAELLERFGRDRDEAAFAALVTRHGPMVLRVCRRILGDRAAAEDCFQATFLVLSRKVRTLRRPELLAGWLHGVALRIAAEARRARFRRRLTPMSAHVSDPPDPHPDPLEQLTARELLIAVDEEVERLPQAYRLPVILCCLEGLSQEETARCLGWKPGSVKARLERGRKRLFARLAKRGITLPAALVAAALARGAASAAVGSELRAATVKAAARFAAGFTAQGAHPCGTAGTLAEAALQNLAAGKLKIFALLAALGALAIAGAGGLAWPEVGERPPNVASQRRDKPSGDPDAVQPAPAPDPAPRLDRSGDLLPPGALARLGTLRFRGNYHNPMALAADGKTAISVSYEETRFSDVTTGKTIWRMDTKQGGGGHAVAYSPNGRLAASLLTDGELFQRNCTLHLWEPATGRQLAKLALKMKGTDCVAFSPDGNVLAVGGFSAYYGMPQKPRNDSMVSLWQWNGAALKPLWEAKPDSEAVEGRRPQGIRSVAFSPDGKQLATGGLANGIIRIWDVAQGKEVRRMKGSGTLIHVLAFAPSGQTLVSGSEDGAVELWETATGAKKWQSMRPGEVRALAFAPDEKTLVAGGGSGVWATSVKRQEPFFVMLDPKDGREVGRHSTERNTVTSLAFSKDGKVFAAGLGDTLRVWEGIAGKERTVTNGHENAIASVAVSEDDNLAVTGGSDGVIILWDLASGTEKRRLRGHTGWVRAVALVPGSKLLASASTDQTVRLWDLAAGKEIRRLEGSPDGSLYAVAVAPGGNMLASGDNHAGTVQVWNVATGQQLHALKLSDEERRGVTCLAFSPDGKTLAAGERILRYDEVELTSRVLLWDAMSGKKLREFPAHKYAVDSLAFSPDGLILASTGTFNKSVSLWDVETGKGLLELPCASPFGVAVFSPDGKTLAWGSSAGDVWLWETATKKLRRKFSGHSTSVKSLAFSPDGRALVSASQDTTAMVWDVPGHKSTKAAPPPFSRDKLRSLWNALADADAVEAGRSIWAFSADPRQAVPFIAERLRELPPADPQRIPQLVADLDSPNFKLREVAEKRLEALGKLAEPSLRAALTRLVSLEVRRRIEKLLDKREAAVHSPATLQTLRALEALEHVGTPEARQALDSFAKQAPAVYFQQEAKAAAERILKRSRGMSAR
jgi:RNA polymerase sigma factor (sigma-70 family)